MTDLPGFLPPAVEGHAGRIRSLDVAGIRVLAFLGRTHFYEGRGVEPVVHGVRVAAAAGCRTIVLTNACGGLRPGLKVGEPVLIRDHLNLTARTPLVGARFVDLSEAYSARLRALVQRHRPDDHRGRLRPVPRAAVRDARRGPDGRHPGRRPGRHVDGARGDRRARRGLRGARPVARNQPGRRVSGDALDHEEVLAAGRAAATRMGALLGRTGAADMTVLITGSAGRIGSSLMQTLPGLGWAVRGFDRVAAADTVVGDLTVPADVDAAMDGVEAVVHLAGQPTEAPWPVVREANIEGSYQLFESARRAGVPTRRVSRRPTTPSGSRRSPAGCRPMPRPGRTRCTASARSSARHWRATTSTATACGSRACASGRSRRAHPTCGPLSTWLSPGRLRPARRRLPALGRDLGFAIVWGISANTRRTWSLDEGTRAGLRAARRRRAVRPRHRRGRTPGVRRVRGRRLHLAGLRHRRSRRSRMSSPHAAVLAWIDDEVDPGSRPGTARPRSHPGMTPSWQTGSAGR